jgi:prepilin-type N-terminal cleavage/methylation domain-containing protein
MIRRLRKRLGAEDGFTLIELLTAASIGTIVLMAAFMVLDRSNQVQRELADRSDALQRGRNTLELITRQLRSQVCLGSATEPITDGRPNTVAFYADLSDGSRNPEVRQLTFDPAKKVVTEYRYAGTGAYPDLTFPVAVPANATSTRVIGTGIVAQKVGAVDQPIFRYYAWKDAGNPGEMIELPNSSSSPLSSTDVSRTVMVKVQLVAQPIRYASTPKLRDSATLENQAYVRSADPMKPKEGAKCL